MSRSDLRVLFFGMLGEFSVEPLRRLIGAGVKVCGAVVPGDNFNLLPPVAQAAGGRKKEAISLFAPLPPASSVLLPILQSAAEHNILSLAHKHNVPTLAVKSLKAPEALTALSSYQPDVICVACWPQIFPRALLELPPLGCLNLHPSLLPAYRGPAPLFWQFREGEANTGVTVHFMDEGPDTGDIALQRAVEFPDGISGPEADRLCSSVGAELMVEAVRLLERGECPRRKQTDVGRDGPAERFYQAWPTEADFEIPVTWSARRAFNFMRGTEHWGVPYSIDADDGPIEARRALAFTAGERWGKAWERVGDAMWIQFADGVLQVGISEIKALSDSALDT